MGPCFGEGTLDEGVLSIHYRRFGIAAQDALDALLFLAACHQGIHAGAAGIYRLHYLRVVLQKFDRKIAGGEAGAEVLILLEYEFDAVYALLKFMPVIDVDVACKARRGILIHLHDGIEEFFHSPSVPADRGAYRHTEQVAQLPDIYAVSLSLEFVVHVKGHDHPEVHVDQLGGQVEIALYVGSVHHVQHDVRSALEQVPADVEFFRTVGGERVCAGQIHQGDLVSLMLEVSLLGIHGHAAVVTHVLVRAGCNIEKRGLAAIRVAYQGDAYVVAALFGQFDDFPVENGGERLARMLRGDVRLSFFFADDLDFGGLLAAERDFVTKYFVFDRVLERGVQHHPHGLAADEAHLYEALAEASMPGNLCYDGALAGM